MYSVFAFSPLSIPPCPSALLGYLPLDLWKTATQCWWSGMSWLCHCLGSQRWPNNHPASISCSELLSRQEDMLFPSCCLQGDVVRHPLSLCKVLRLVLSNDVPGYAIVHAVLQQHCFVHSVGAAEVTVATVCLCCAPNLQDKHNFAEKKYRGINFRWKLENI